MVSGVAVAITMTPFDVISTRLYNQPVDELKKVCTDFSRALRFRVSCGNRSVIVFLLSAPPQGRFYTGFLDCLMKVSHTEGLLGLYKGMGPVFMRLAPHTVLSMLLWDVMRQKALQHYAL